MRLATAVFLTMSLLASASTFEAMELPEDADHIGVRHVEGASDRHHHGDADDHHESPESPCHHHEDTVCAGHGHDLGFLVLNSIVEPGIARLFKVVTIEPSDTHSIHWIWHIPIS